MQEKHNDIFINTSKYKNIKGVVVICQKKKEKD